MQADTVIVGGGLIGLAVARAIRAEGLKVIIVRSSFPGEASPAAAGMLAPSVERAKGPAHEFAVASRDSFPEYLNLLAAETGIDVSLNRLGILQVALTPRGIKGLKGSILPGAEWIDATALHELEPSLSHGLGAVYSLVDGAVDNVALLDALSSSIQKTRVEVLDDKVISVTPGPDSVQLRTASHRTIDCGRIVVAAGAWTSSIAGLAYGNQVRPLRGQMVSYDATPLRHVVYGPRGYLVPRARGHVLAGSTMEDVGYDSATTSEGIARVRSAAVEICPMLESVQSVRFWAGLRPVTSDLLPLLGPDPDDPRIIYACGHSRNGVLLAPLTAEIVADLVVGRRVDYDLSQFRPDRFQY